MRNRRPYKSVLIARQEYLKNVRRRSFLLVTFGMPVLMIALMAISVVSSSRTGDAATVGYVDQGGVLSARVEDPGFRAVASVEEATAALEAEEIRGCYVVASDHAASGKVEMLYWDRQPSAGLQERFDEFLRGNVVGGLAPEVAARALAGPEDLVVRTADGSRESDSSGLLSLILPFALDIATDGCQPVQEVIDCAGGGCSTVDRPPAAIGRRANLLFYGLPVAFLLGLMLWRRKR